MKQFRGFDSFVILHSTKRSIFFGRVLSEISPFYSSRLFSGDLKKYQKVQQKLNDKESQKSSVVGGLSNKILEKGITA